MGFRLFLKADSFEIQIFYGVYSCLSSKWWYPKCKEILLWSARRIYHSQWVINAENHYFWILIACINVVRAGQYSALNSNIGRIIIDCIATNQILNVIPNHLYLPRKCIRILLKTSCALNACQVALKMSHLFGTIFWTRPLISVGGSKSFGILGTSGTTLMGQCNWKKS